MSSMKFRTLFIKELREMLNTQTILAMVVAVVVMGFAGRTMSRAVEESAETMMDINICDNDNTEFTQNMIKFMTNNLAQLGGEVNVIEINSDDYAEELKKADVKNVVLIPEGFTESVEQNKSAQVQYIQQLNSLATFSNLNAGSQVAVE